MPLKDTTLEIGVRLSARSAPVCAGAGGGSDLDGIRVETLHIGGNSFTRAQLEKLWPGVAAFLDDAFIAEEDGDGWAS